MPARPSGAVQTTIPARRKNCRYVSSSAGSSSTTSTRTGGSSESSSAEAPGSGGALGTAGSATVPVQSAARPGTGANPGAGPATAGNRMVSDRPDAGGGNIVSGLGGGGAFGGG